MIDYQFPTNRDELAITLAKYATLWGARDKDDDPRGKLFIREEKLR